MTSLNEKQILFIYFFSVWTLNLGVVPWFLSAAFLFCPIFFSLLLRLFLVTLVRETICILPTSFQNRHMLVPKVIGFVKILLILSITTPCLAASHYLSIGEHLSIPIKNDAQFIIGNKEIISGKVIQDGVTLLIKAKHLGLSEILILRNGQKKSIKIIVINKTSQEKLYYLKKRIESVNLSSRIMGRIIFVSGKVQSKNTYSFIIKLAQEHSIINLKQIKIKASLKKELLEQIYRDFYNEFIENLKCSFEQHRLKCIINKYKQGNQLLIYYKKLYGVKFIPTETLWQNENFSISLNLIQVESTKASNINWGLSNLNIPIKNLIKSNWKTLLENNLNLQGGNSSISLLAKPTISLVENENAIIKIGSEIPFQESSSLGANTLKWKFIGFKLKIRVIKKNNKFLVYYQTEFKRPINNQATSGATQKSVILIPINSTKNIFEINYEVTNSINNFFPILGKIPLLGKLFTSKQSAKSFKKIIGLITINKGTKQ